VLRATGSVVGKSIRPDAQGEVRPARSRTGGGLLGILALAAAASADLTVHDSLNRYSLYGRSLVSFGDNANSAAGGWVGSDSLIDIYGNNSLRSNVTSGYRFNMGNAGPDSVWGWLNVKSFIQAPYNFLVDSGILVGDSAYFGHNTRSPKGVRVGAGSVGVIKLEANGTNYDFGGGTFTNGSTTRYSGSGVSGVTWNSNPSPPYMSFILPDTSITPAGTPPDIDASNWLYDNKVLRCADAPLAAIPGCKDTTITMATTGTITVGRIPPGNYGDLKLGFGTDLYMGEGVYSFRSIHMKNGSGNSTRLLAIQPNGVRTVVYTELGMVADNPDAARPTIIAPIDYEKGYGIGTNQFAGGTMMIVSHADVLLPNYTEVWSTITVPSNTIRIKDKVKLFGQAFAQRIIADNNFKGTDGAFIPYFPNPPVVTVKNFDASVTEGNPGDVVNAKFLLTMDHINGVGVWVFYHTEEIAGTGDSLATFTADFKRVTQDSILIGPTFLYDTIRVPITNDNTWENTERFKVVLDSSRFGTLGTTRADSVGIGTIYDNDDPPLFRFVKGADSAAESVANPVIAIELNLPQTGPVSVDVIDRGTGTATWNSDYTLPGRKETVVFPAGTTLVNLTKLAVTDDHRYEPTETIRLALTNPVGGRVDSTKDTVHIQKILDNDPRPVVRMKDTTIVEGPASVRKTVWTRVYLADSATGRAITSADSVSGFDIPFTWLTTSRSAKAGGSDTDYVKQLSVRDTLHAGQVSRTLSVVIRGDDFLEGSEYFDVSIDSFSNVARGAQLDTASSITILDDEGRPALRVSGGSVTEPDAPASDSIRFIVTLYDSTLGTALTAANAPKLPVSYSWSASDLTARAGFDYDTTGRTGTRTIPAGALVDSFWVKVLGDDRYEGTETFSVTIVPGTNANPTSAQNVLTATGTINDDETAPGVCVADTSVSEASATSSIRVFLANGSCATPLTALQAPEVPVKFSWSTADSTAKAPGDYSAVSGKSDSVSAFSVSRILSVGIVNDAVWEGSEPFKVSLAGLVNGTALKTTAIDVVQDDESAPTATVTPVPVTKNEGNTGTTAFQFLVKLSHRSELPVRFTWSTVGATGGDPATAGTDYVAESAKQDSVRHLDDSVLLTVNVNGDLTFENDEVFGVRVTPVSNISGTVADAKGTIVNDDGAPRILSITPVSDFEGNAGTTKTFAFKLKLSAPSGLPSTFTWSTFGGSGYDSASVTEDFVGVTGQSVTIAAGADSAFLNVTINGDAKLERDEAFRVVATATAAGNLRDTVFVVGGTIRNDDAQPVVAIADAASVQEPGAIGQSTTASFNVSLSAASGLPVTVDWTTYDSSASASQKDYKDSTGTLTFAPGQTSKTVLIRVLGDSLYERTERFWTSLVSATGASLGRDSALGTIADNDTAPAIHVDGLSLSEPATGSTPATLRVWIERPSALPVTFRWYPVDGTARASTADYDTSSAILDTIPAFTTQVSEVVQVRADDIANEGTEHLRVLLTQVVGASGTDTADTVKIVDATPQPTVTLSGADTLDEANVDVPLTVTLNRRSATAVRVLVRTRDLSATTATGDYRKDDLWVTIPAGSLSVATGSARILEDGLYEDSIETFQASIDSAEGALRNSTPVVVGIRDDEPVPTLSVDSSVVAEPAAHGATVAARFKLHLSGPSQNPITVSWTTDSVSARPILDYQHRSAVATFEPGTVLDTAVVNVLGDSLDEVDETYLVRLSAPAISGAAKAPTLAKDTALGTILDEDAAPRLFVDDPAPVAEGGTILFTATLERPSAKDISFAWRTLDSAVGVGFATEGLDYTAATLHRDTLFAGQRSITLPVSTLADLIAGEGTERFLVDLSALTNATPGDLRGIGSIAEGTGIPKITIDSVGPVHEADSTVRFRVTLSTTSATDVLVKFRTVAGSATAGEDFVDTTGTLRIPADSLGAFLPVRILDDLRDEDSLETFTVVLSDSDAAVVQQGTGLGRLLDDEAAPTVSVLDDTVAEPAAQGAVDSIRVKVRLSAVSDLPVQVSVQTLDASAVSPLDYIARGAIVTIPPRTLEVEFAVAVLGDTLDEIDESFRVVLSKPGNATFADSLADVLVRDEDASPALVLSGTSAAEGQTAHVEAILARPSALDVVLVWRTPSTGTATSGLDYTAIPARRDTIKAGTTRVVLDVPVLSDTVANEAGEWFQVRLDSLVNASLSDSSATITILDLTPAPRLTIHVADTVQEGSPWMVFPVTMDRSSATRVAVRFRTQSGTALGGLDYRDTTGILVIPAGSTTGEIRVAVIDDVLYESAPESLLVVLDSADSALVAVDRAEGWIRDNGDNPPLTLGDASAVVEGGVLRYPLHLENPSAGPVVVRWRTEDGTATGASGDYVADSGSVVIPAGDTAATIQVRTLVDGLWELTETVKVRIDTVEGCFLAVSDDSVGIGSILEEGAFPSVEIVSPDTAVREDASAPVPVAVRLTRRASIPLSVRVVAGTTGTATWGTDLSFVASDLSLDTLRFEPGDSLRTFHLSVAADSIDEFDETAPLGLVPVDSMKVLDGLYALTILDDDSAPEVVFEVDTQTVSEGVGRVLVTAHLSRASGKVVDVWYSVSGTATAGGVDHDMVPFHFTFRTGSDTANVAFLVTDDRLQEDTETVAVQLDSTRNGNLAAGVRQIVRIVDNDGAPKAWFADSLVTVKENVGTITLAVRMDHPSIRPTSFEIVARAGSATLDSVRQGSDALLGADVVYRVTIPAYDTAATFVVSILDDGRVESTEDFRLVLSGADNADPATSSQVRVVVLDDDRYPEVVITRPQDSLRTNQPNHVIEWTWDKVAQTPSDTTLLEGWNRIRRCAVDTAGNRACDSVDVFGDFTPPKVTITRPESLFLTNKPVVNVCWTVVDSGATWRKVDSLCGDTTLTEGVHPVVKRSCDDLGNCSQDQVFVRVDLTPPTGVFVRPPDSSHVRMTDQPALIRWIDDGDTIWVPDTLHLGRFGWNTFTATYTDKAGNTGSTSVHLFLEIPEVQKGWFLDTDGDGDIDAAVVEFDAPWVSDTLPTFSFRLGDQERTEVKVDGWYKDGTRGTPALDKDGKVVTQDGKVVYLAPGIPVTAADGTPLKDPETGKVLTSPVGEVWRDASGKPVYDAQGRELYRVPGPGTEDRSRMVVKFGNNFPYGVTSVDSSTDSGRLVVSLPVYGENGSATVRDVVASFPMHDSVAPIIAKAEVRRTEDYEGMDTLFVTPSEGVQLDETRGLIEIKVNGIWHTVPQDSVFQAEDGRIWFLVAPGDSGSPRPGVEIRFLEGVTDLKGNGAEPGTSTWTTTVIGPPRPPLLKVELPTPVKSVPAEEMRVNRPGGFVIRATDRGSDDQYSWWKPGAGYVDGSDPDIRNICPDLRFCNGIELYVNRPVRMILYMYDLSGTFVVSQEINITQEDIDGLRADKLDRVRIQLQWNMRDSKGQVVGSGVYLWRIVSYVRSNEGGTPIMTNQVVKVGVKSVLQ